MSDSIYISIDQVIAAAKMRLRLQDSSDSDNFLELQILYANRNIGSLDSFIVCNQKLEVTDNTACLPANYKEMIAIRFINEQKNVINNKDNTLTYQYGVYVSQPFFNNYGCDMPKDINYNWLSGTYMIQGNQIIFNGKMIYKEVWISYLGYNVDELGRPYIFVDAEQCLTAWACYQYALSFPESYTPLQIGEWKKEYAAQRAWVKGTAAARNFKTNKAQIREQANALINSKTIFVN